VFANYGYLIRPQFIVEIIDRRGNVINQNTFERRRVIDKATAYIMTNLLESVVKDGTGRRVKSLGRPVAGKTGTTDNFHDAWFIGYTPQYVTGVWVGFDNEKSLGEKETGSRAASPIWLDFMKKVLKDKPIENFRIPDGIVFTKIDAETGLLPSYGSKKTIFECFKEGAEPGKLTQESNGIANTARFYKKTM
jgi:penicillin-binding protein 1A